MSTKGESCESPICPAMSFVARDTSPGGSISSAQIVSDSCPLGPSIHHLAESMGASSGSSRPQNDILPTGEVSKVPFTRGHESRPKGKKNGASSRRPLLKFWERMPERQPRYGSRPFMLQVRNRRCELPFLQLRLRRAHRLHQQPRGPVAPVGGSRATSRAQA